MPGSLRLLAAAGASPLITAVLPCALAAQSPARWDSVAAILETRAIPSAGYVRFNFPRRDLVVRIGDVVLASPLATGAWAGFSATGRRTMVMGDLVLTAGEVKPVLAALARQHIAVTGIHNHLIGEEPRLVYVHFHGEGDAIALAAGLDSALALTSIPRPVASLAAPPVTIDTSLVFGTFGRPGHAEGNVVQLGLDLVRRRVRWNGETLVPALAYGTPINIQAVNPSRAVATGDFALLAPQVPRVLEALAAAGITADALHTHMVGEAPTVYFIHFWADGPLAEVVRGLKAAVDSAR